MPAPVITQSWLDLQPIGNLIEGTRFFALKTPMSRHIFEANKTKEEKHFMPPDLVKHVNSTGKRIGMIIDLSSGTEYYNSEELKRLGVEKYVKLRTRKRTLLEVSKKFNEIVKEFLASHPDPDCLIGVHCYHGLQRTSFMICSFMIDELGLDVETAIERFETARGHEIGSGKNWLYKVHSKH